MSYLVFARKYRPQTFTEVLGQGPIVTTLTNAIRQRRIGHAYLFAGPRGTGKTSTARIFAKALNCKEGPTPTPCLTCERCQDIARGNSLDVLEIDGASNRGIDQIRTLRELAKFTPAAGAFKVYIIDEVHQITSEGFNALLKTLEEPPPHVLFILATTAPHKVPATILSRCQRYDFKRLPLELIVAKLKGIAADEKLQLSEEAAVGIARTASGSLRDAESLLDQAAAFTGGPIQGEDVKALLGTIDEDTFAEAVTGIQARDPARLLHLVGQITNDGTDLLQWVLEFLSFLRNLLVVKVGAAPLGLEGLGPEALERLTNLVKGFSVEDLTAIAQVLERCVEMMRRAGEPRIPLEMALVRLGRGESWVAISELLAQLQAMEERLKGGDQSKSDLPASSSAPSQSAPQRVPPSGSSFSQAVSLDQVRATWPTFLEELHREKASTAAYLNEASPIGLEGENPPQVVIGFSKEFEFHKEALSRPETRSLIEKILSSLLKAPLRCSFRTVDSISDRPLAQQSQSNPAGEPSPESSPPHAEPEPTLLNSVIELFEGRVLPGEG